MKSLEAYVEMNVNVEAEENDTFHDFSGTVTGTKGNLLQVTDQDDDVWDVKEAQVRLTDTHDYLYKHIEFNEGTEDLEMNFDPGMRARVLSIVEHSNAEGVLEIQVDFSHWEDYNKDRAVPNFYQDGVPCLRWHESQYYPKNGVETFYCNEGSLPFAFAPIDELEIKANEVIAVVQKLIEDGHIRPNFCDAYGIREMMKELA